MAESKPTKLHPNTKDISGIRFGKLYVLTVSHSRKCPNFKGTVLYWKCVCDCGNEVSVPAPSLNSGDAQSCGCWQKERTRAASRTHGLRHTPEFNIWNAMKQRCQNPKNHAYQLYGGRGITVCQRWSDSFELFYADMGPRPAGLSLDRINNDGNYEPGNVRWADALTQRHNQRRAR